MIRDMKKDIKMQGIEKCIFCEQPISGEFRKDYILITWTDDPDNRNSPNKIVKLVHKKCWKRFLELNFLTTKK